MYEVLLQISLLQVNRHFDVYQMKPEMTLEKLQLIATAKVGATFKGRWCRWWNLSKGSRQEYNFPASPASDIVLRGWIDKAAFFAGVNLSINLL